MRQVQAADREEVRAVVTKRRRTGQAMVEMVAGLLVLLVLLVGLLQVGRLAIAHNQVMVAARTQADEQARSRQQVAAGLASAYLLNMHPGHDNVFYSQHDMPVSGPHEPVSRAVLRPARMPVLQSYAGITPLHEADRSQHITDSFRWVRGRQRTARIPVYPVMRRWVVRDEHLQLEHEVWLPWLGGLDE